MLEKMFPVADYIDSFPFHYIFLKIVLLVFMVQLAARHVVIQAMALNASRSVPVKNKNAKKTFTVTFVNIQQVSKSSCVI